MEVVGKQILNRANLQKRLGERIKELRKQRGLTQEGLAEGMDVHPSLIGPIESGNKFPRALTFARLAQALNVPLYQLWMFEPDVPVKQKNIQELLDFLKNRPEKEAAFLLSVAQAALKYYH